MQQQFEGSVCRDQQTCSFDNQHCSINIAHTHVYVAVDPLSCDDISRAMFIGMICLNVWWHFEGGDNSMCGDISRKYGSPARIPCMHSIVSKALNLYLELD